MKQRLRFIVFLSIVILFGCKKKSSSPSIYKMDAMVDTAHFNGSNCIAIHANGLFSPYSLSIYGGFFNGSNPTTPYINLNIGNYTGVGTYIIDSISNSASIDSNATPLLAVHGSIVIYSISQYISGSFSFTISDSTKVMSGTFTAKSP